MGVIVNQSIKGSVYSYIGAAVGFVNTAVLFPEFFEPDQIGLVFLLISVGLLFAQFFGLGFSGVVIRLFPYFHDDKKGHNGFPFVMFSTVVVGIVLFLITYYFVRPLIIEQNSHSQQFIEVVDLVIPIVIIEILFKTLNSYTSALLNSVIGTFYKEFILRLIISVFIVLFIFKFIDFQLFLYLYIAAQAVPLIALLIYLLRKGDLSLKPVRGFISADLKKSMFFTALVSVIVGLSATGYSYIDKYMINTILDLSNTGVYTIAFFFGSIIGLPSRALSKIASIIIAKAWKENNISEIRVIYSKSSLTQTVIGVFVFLGIMINLDSVILILGDKYIEGKMVIFFIGMASLIGLVFGVSAPVIANSTQYRMLSYMMFVFLIVVVITNYIFIPLYGISGAAFASVVSVLFYSLLKYLYVLSKFKMQPFSVNHLTIFGLGIVMYFVFYFFPDISQNHFVNIIFKSVFFSAVYLFLIYKFRVSVDINERLEATLAVIKSKLN